MLEQIIAHYTGGNKAKFAKLLDVKPQLISTWKKRNTYDAELLFEKCKDISAAWLLSGEGDMIYNKQNDNRESIGANNNSELIALCKALVDNYQQRDDVMGKLVSMVKEMK